MAKPSFENWKKVLGHTIDLDNQSYDCVDVPKSWAEFGTGKPWQTSLCWGNAKDIWGNAPDAYWSRIPRGQAQVGDIMCCDGSIGGGYGHVAVVVAVNGNNITVYQQNTFTQQPVYTGVYGQNSSYIQGFLRPKFDFSLAGEAALAGNQRVTSDVVNYRQAANRSAALMVTDGLPDGKLKAGETYDFKGFVRGESVDGNPVWFVGAYTGGYAWSGGFTDMGTHDLPDITPAPAATISPTERQVGGDAMNYRRSPQVAPDNVIQLLPAGRTVKFTGFVHGMSVDGNNIWFFDGTGYVWSGGFIDSGTHDLADLTNTSTPAPVATYPKPTNDPQVTAVYNKKHPLPETYAPTDLVAVGGGQTLRKEAADSLALMNQVTQTLSPASGYRSYATQVTVYANEVATVGKEQADRESARPGYSEHQTGLTMDFAPIDDSFKNGVAYPFLVANGYKYGWILRYPSDKEAVTGYMSEPWHWRYVGVDVATDMHNKGITTLEEYYHVEGGAYPDATTPDTPTDPGTPTTPTTPSKPIIKLSDLKAVLVNVGITFIQAFTAVWALTGYQLDKGAIGGAIGAGLSVVWNTIVKPFLIAKGLLKK